MSSPRKDETRQVKEEDHTVKDEDGEPTGEKQLNEEMPSEEPEAETNVQQGCNTLSSCHQL